MKKTVGVITNDEYLFKKIKLAAIDYADVFSAEAESAAGRYECMIADIDYAEAPLGAIRASRTAECDIRIPFSFDELERAIMGSRGALLRVPSGERCAFLRGALIPLTDVEYRLISCLINAKDYVSREELLHEVWGDCTNDGVINVYIHYLREKLETSGEKIIISSRKYGYKIDEKFIKEDSPC